MAMGYRARKRLAILILLVGVPAYVVLTVTVLNLLDRPPIWLELAVYVGLGIAWALPLRWVFLGIGRPDPDAGPNADPDAGTDADPGPGRGD